MAGCGLIRDPAGAQGDLAGGHAGDEAPPSDLLVRPQRDGEDVQMPLFHEMDARGIVHGERTMRPGLDSDAADTLDDGGSGHRVSPT